MRALPLATAAVTLVAMLSLAACAGPTVAASTPAPMVTSQAPAPSATVSTNEGSTARPTEAGACVYSVGSDPARPVDPPASTGIETTGTVTYTLKMTAGDVVITMDRSKAPCAIHSFESLVAQGFYDKVKCHRLVEVGIFILQCGDPTGTGSGGPGYTFADETYPDDTYPAGTVAMANAGRDTNGSQFFLVWGDSELKPNYTILGHMDAASTAVVAKMASEGIDARFPNGPSGGRPINPSEILSISAG